MILTVAHIRDGKLAASAKEALAAARALAVAGGGPVGAVALGQGLQPHAQALIAAGADTVYTAEHAELASYQPDAWLKAVQAAAEAAKPAVILLPHDDASKDLAPKLAFRLQAGLVMDCIALEAKESTLLATKPVYGGNALAVYEIDSPVRMATLRAKAFDPLPDDPARQGSVVPLDVAIDTAALKVRVVETRREPAAAGVRLEDAAVVVAGGRGLGSAAPFQQLEELAAALGGAVGATRAVCDAGWVPHSLQVGLTGKTVAPNLYIAVGISGASQHMAGCAGARNIVAINKDKGSNIFKEARFGAAGNWEEILPAFLGAVKELRQA